MHGQSDDGHAVNALGVTIGSVFEKRGICVVRMCESGLGWELEDS